MIGYRVESASLRRALGEAFAKLDRYEELFGELPPEPEPEPEPGVLTDAELAELLDHAARLPS